MKIIDVSDAHALPITQYASHDATNVHVADGQGEAHIHYIRFAPGGLIGPHLTNFGQLFLVVAGAGWVSGSDDARVPIGLSQAALFARGERHAKGSDTGMTAVMIQIDTLAAAPQAFES